MNPTNNRFVTPSQEKFFFDGGQRQEINARRNRVRMYFIGYKLLDEKGNSPVIPVKQKPIQMPPIGGYLDIDEVYYQDILLRTQMFNPKTQSFVDAVTLDSDIASSVKSAYDKGLLKDDIDSFAQVIQVSTLANMSMEELEAELARRKSEPEPTEIAVTEEAFAVDETKKSSSRSTAKK